MLTVNEETRRQVNEETSKQGDELKAEDIGAFHDCRYNKRGVLIGSTN